MSAGPKFFFLFIIEIDYNRYEYLWADGEVIKKPIKVSGKKNRKKWIIRLFLKAPEYVDYLMTWIQGILDDETIFPSRVG